MSTVNSIDDLRTALIDAMQQSHVTSAIPATSVSARDTAALDTSQTDNELRALLLVALAKVEELAKQQAQLELLARTNIDTNSTSDELSPRSSARVLRHRLLLRSLSPERGTRLRSSQRRNGLVRAACHAGISVGHPALVR